MRGGDLIILGTSAALAIGVPLSAKRIVDVQRTDHVIPALSRALGEDVDIGDVEVTPLGSVRLARVRIGGLLAADSISASVGLGTLMRGRFAADEIQVERPRVTAAIAADGSSDVARLFARLRDRRHASGAGGAARAGGEAAGGARRVRRIVVTGGDLVVTIAGHGELHASGLELEPQEGGVRVVAGALSIAFAGTGWSLGGSFARSGFDVSLPDLHVSRAALAGGRLALGATHGGAAPLEIEGAVLTRGLEVDRPGETRLEGRVRGGEPLALHVTHTAQGDELALEATDLPLAPLAATLPASWSMGLDIRGAHLTGHVTGGVDRATGELHADGDVTLRGLALDHDLLASEPLPLDGAFVFEGTWARPSREGRVHVQAKIGELAWTADAELALDARGAAQRGHLVADVPTTSCAGVFAAIPLPLREHLEGLVLDGTIGGHVEIGFDRAADAPPAQLDVDLAVGCKVVQDATAADPTRLAGAYPWPVPGGGQRLMAASDPSFVTLAKLPPHVAAAFLAGEDARFYLHHGFDGDQLRRSFQIDVAAGKIERGGSTITQQLVKNLWLSRERTLGRKLLEAVLTWRVEQSLPKARILEVYLNLIELGEGVHGLGPAAMRWFGKPPEKLTVAEAAFLAALTPAPVSLDRRLKAETAPDADMTSRVRTILHSMWVNRLIDTPTYNRALQEKLQLHPLRPA